jgi:hypothetical protein
MAAPLQVQRGPRGGFLRRTPALSPLEKAIQRAVVDHWKALGLPDTLVAAIPNQGALGQPGLTAGVADLLVIGPDLPHGARAGFIELKRDPWSKVSDAQRAFGELCFKLDIPFAITVGRDQPIAVLEAWGVVRKALV